MSANPRSPSSPVAAPVILAADINLSCRMPLLTIFVSSAIWLLISSILGLIASIKFHSPNFLANTAWLTYGRVHPAANNALLYGFCLQAGLGVTFWLFAALGRTLLAQPLLVTVGAKLWNLGVTIGVLGILAGGATGYETLDMPRYAALLLLLAYLLIGLWAALTFHQRTVRPLFVSHWFLLAALFWFPWIYTTANLLVILFPVRGVAQAVIAWWFANNLQVVWLGLVGLGTAFYFIPRLTNRELHSHYLALITFWMLILFGSWGGIPNSAPVPAWMPALSTAATMLTVIPLLAVAVNFCQTCSRRGNEAEHDPTASVEPKSASLPRRLQVAESSLPSVRFIGFGVAAFIVAGLMSVVGSLVQVSQITDLTWFTPARLQLNNYGFFAMVMFGAIYLIVPQIMGHEFPKPTLVRAHFWLAAIGVVLIVLPLALGGILQGFKMQNTNLPFTDVVKGTLPFLRASTMGDLLLAAGHALFVVNLGGLAVRFYRARAMTAFTTVTADIYTAEARP